MSNLRLQWNAELVYSRLSLGFASLADCVNTQSLPEYPVIDKYE